jgi:hypothetical protein
MDPAVRSDLEAFLDRVDKVAACRLLQRPIASAVEIRYQQGAGLAMKSETPPEEEFEYFLYRLRPLLLIPERTSIKRVHDLCHQRLRSRGLMEEVTRCFRLWKRAQKATVFRLIVDDKEWTPEYVAWLLLNVGRFHDDAEKKAQLDKLGIPGRMIAKQMLVVLALQTGSAARHLADVVRQGLAEDSFR